MKYFAAILFLSMWLVSCGSSDKKPVPTTTPPPVPPPAANGWSEQTKSSLKNTCVQNGGNYYPEYPQTQFVTYCGCLVDSIASRWSYQQFNSNRSQILSTIENDGTDQKCISQAGFYNGQNGYNPTTGLIL